jgi:hypothetical protein
MRAIKIDVEKAMVYEIDLAKGLKPMYDAIGNGCSLIEAPARFPDGDALFCDEEITFRPSDMKGAFSLSFWDLRDPIINNAIIVGGDEEGESKDAVMDIQDIIKSITFYSIRQR